MKFFTMPAPAQGSPPPIVPLMNLGPRRPTNYLPGRNNSTSSTTLERALHKHTWTAAYSSMPDEKESTTAIRIKGGDNASQCVDRICAIIARDSAVTLTNAENSSCQKLIAVIERVKARLREHKTPFHQFNRLLVLETTDKRGTKSESTTTTPTSGKRKRDDLDTDNKKIYRYPRLMVRISTRRDTPLPSSRDWMYQS